MKILVTGGTGNVGGAVVKELLKRGAEVRVLARKQPEAGKLPAGVEIVSGYDRSGLIQDSIATLQRDLLEEAVIVSLVIIVFLFHFRSAISFSIATFFTAIEPDTGLVSLQFHWLKPICPLPFN